MKMSLSRPASRRSVTCLSREALRGAAFAAFLALAGVGASWGQADKPDEEPKSPAGESEKKPTDEKAEKPTAESLEALIQKVEMPPITYPKTSVITYEIEQQHGAWLKKLFVPAIDRELDGVLVDEKKKALVEKMIGTWAGSTRSEIQRDYTYSEFEKEVSALVSPEANAPAFQTFAGYIALEGRKRDEAPTRWRGTIDRLDPDKGPGLAGWLAMGCMMQYGFLKPNDPGVDEKLARFLEAALRPGQWEEENVHLLVYHINSYNRSLLFRGRGKQFGEIFRASKLPEWAKLALIGFAEMEMARSEGREHLDKARAVLSESWKLRPDRPEAATNMMNVIMGSPRPEGEPRSKSMRMWFDRAIAAQCDFKDAYVYMTAGHRPGAGGSAAEMAAFALAIAEADNSGTRTGFQFMPALYDMAVVLGDWRPIFKNKTIGQWVIRLRQKILDRQTTEYGKREMNGFLAFEAWLCGEYEIAAAALEKVGDSRKLYFVLPPPVLPALKRLGIEPREFSDDCRVRGGKYKEAFLDISKARGEKRYLHAVKAVNTLMEDPEPLKDPYLFAIGNMVDFEAKYFRREWRSLPMAYFAWRSRDAVWKRSPTLIETNGLHGPDSPLMLQATLGDRYEVRGQIEFPQKQGKLLVGFVLGSSTVILSQGVAVTATSPDGKTLSFQLSDGLLPGRPKFPISGKWPLPAPGESIDFRIRRDGNRLTLWLGEEMVLVNREVTAPMATGASAFGIVAAGGTAEERVIFKKLEGRQLDKE